MTDSPGSQEGLRKFGEKPIPVPTKGPVSLEDALEMGNLLEFLRLAAMRGEQYPIGTGDDGAILDSLERLETILKTSHLETTVTGEIASLIQEVGGKYDKSDNLDQADREYLKQKSVAWHHLLREVLSREQRIPAENTGLLDVDKLVEAPQELFSTPVWNWLDERPRSDIEEACKSIVVGSSTASVMLSLRAVEHCLRKWYEQEDEHLEAAWGQVLDRLMEEYTEDEKRNDTVATQLSDLPPGLSNLYYLKEKRNEVNHPVKSPNPQEARRTLMIVASTITDIYDEMFEDKLTELKDLEVTASKGEFGELASNPSFDDDVKSLFVHAIRRLDDGDGALQSDIVQLGAKAGFKENEVEDIIQEILMSGSAYEPDHNRLKAI